MLAERLAKCVSNARAHDDGAQPTTRLTPSLLIIDILQIWAMLGFPEEALLPNSGLLSELVFIDINGVHRQLFGVAHVM